MYVRKQTNKQKTQHLDCYLSEVFCGAMLANRTFYKDENIIYPC